jgi:hypothetical protein
MVDCAQHRDGLGADAADRDDASGFLYYCFAVIF